MTSTDDKAKAVMRAYADSLQPPPMAEVIARSGHTQDARYASRPERPRSRGRLVLAAASVAAAITVGVIASDRLPDPGASSAIHPTPTIEAARMAPGCPPGLPLLEGASTVEGKLAKPIAAVAGQQLALTTQIPATAPDRSLLSFTIYIVPPGTNMNERTKAVAQSPVLKLALDQKRLSPVVQIPTSLAPGTYDIVGYATWPGPSLCGFANPADSTQVGSSWGVLGSVVIN